MSEQREILFRGKCVDSGQWIEGPYIQSYASGYIYLDDKHPKMVLVFRETVGQYTGLKDKNGTQIFEGDIVELKKAHQKIPVVGVVEYGRYTDVDSLDNYDYLGWYIKVRGHCVSILQPPVDGIEMEAIGNIHDNPELLETAR